MKRNQIVSGPGSMAMVKSFLEQNEPADVREKLNTMLECFIQYAPVDRMLLANYAGFTHALTNLLCDISQPPGDQKNVGPISNSKN